MIATASARSLDLKLVHADPRCRRWNSAAAVQSRRSAPSYECAFPTRYRPTSVATKTLARYCEKDCASSRSASASEAKLKALKQAARQGWADVSAGRTPMLPMISSRTSLDRWVAVPPSWPRRRADASLSAVGRRPDRCHQHPCLDARAIWRGRPAALESLIVAALRDVATQPHRPGSIARPELGAGVRSWHLRLSRDHVGTSAAVVRLPRHFLVYRFEPALRRGRSGTARCHGIGAALGPRYVPGITAGARSPTVRPQQAWWGRNDNAGV